MAPVFSVQFPPLSSVAPQAVPCRSGLCAGSPCRQFGRLSGTRTTFQHLGTNWGFRRTSSHFRPQSRHFRCSGRLLGRVGRHLRLQEQVRSARSSKEKRGCGAAYGSTPGLGGVPRLQAALLRTRGGTLQAGRPEPLHSPAAPWGGGGHKQGGLACSPRWGPPAAPQGCPASVSVAFPCLLHGAGLLALGSLQEELLPAHGCFCACSRGAVGFLVRFRR